MRSLDSLIKLYTFQLDDKKRKLADIRELAGHITLALQQLEGDVAREQNAARTDTPTYGRDFALYRQQAEKRRHTLLESIQRLEEEIASINEEILLSFQELKRFESANEDRKEQQRAKGRKAEQQFADEISVQRAGMMSRLRR